MIFLPSTQWQLTGVWDLHETKEERDLGVLVTSDLKSSHQYAIAASKARSTLRWIKRNFGCITKYEFNILYKTYVGPHMEICIKAWSPYLEKDVGCLERDQTRETKMVQGLKDLNYEDRLKKLDLYCLQRRRLGGDLIETFKILTDKECIDKRQFFTSSITTNMRFHDQFYLFKTR